MMVFDGWNQSFTDLKKLVSTVGSPKALVNFKLYINANLLS